MKHGWFLLLHAGCGFSVPAGGDGGITGGERPIDMAVVQAPTSPRRVTFNNANVAMDLKNFPVLIPIAGQVDYSLIVDPRTDLRFEDPTDGSTLPYEVETWTPNGESLVWVEVPKIAAFPMPASILMYFGPDAGTANPPAVWSTYEQVNHFAASADDSTMQHHDATSVVGATSVAGYLGNSMTFSTGTDRVVFAGKVFDAWKEGTIEMWIRPLYVQQSDVVSEPKVLTNFGALQLGRFYIDGGNSALVLQIDAKFAGNTNSEIHPDLPFNVWTHVAWSYDGMIWRTFKDGEIAQTTLIGNHDFVASPMSLVLGNDGSGNGARMQIDELRIGQKKRSADWMKAQHASMSRNFVSFSDP